MDKYGWTYEQYENQPAWFIDYYNHRLTEESKRQESKPKYSKKP